MSADAPLPTGQILITGTGRSGTTLLVQLLTFLGMDTGLSADEVFDVDRTSQGGLEELPAMRAPHPRVVKRPFGDDLFIRLTRKKVKIDLAVVAMRDLHASAESRRRVSAIAQSRGEDPLTAAGGVWLVDDADDQEQVLVEVFYAGLHTLAARGIPVRAVLFPEFAEDPSYLYRALRPVFVEAGASKADVAAALTDVVDPAKIHDF